MRLVRRGVKKALGCHRYSYTAVGQERGTRGNHQIPRSTADRGMRPKQWAVRHAVEDNRRRTGHKGEKQALFIRENASPSRGNHFRNLRRSQSFDTFQPMTKKPQEGLIGDEKRSRVWVVPKQSWA